MNFNIIDSLRTCRSRYIQRYLSSSWLPPSEQTLLTLWIVFYETANDLLLMSHAVS